MQKGWLGFELDMRKDIEESVPVIFITDVDVFNTHIKVLNDFGEHIGNEGVVFLFIQGLLSLNFVLLQGLRINEFELRKYFQFLSLHLYNLLFFFAWIVLEFCFGAGENEHILYSNFGLFLSEIFPWNLERTRA